MDPPASFFMTDLSPSRNDRDRAKTLHAAGRFVEAARLYQAILRAAPGDAEMLWRLGEVASRLGLHDRALALLNASLSADPRGIEAWNCLGALLASAGREDEAAAAFARALALAPDYTAALANLGRLQTRRGFVDDALVCLGRCIELEPQEAGHRIDLGDALLATEKYTEALASFTRAHALDPAAVRASLGIGLALAGQNRFAAAADQFARLAASQPRLFEAHYNLALALFRGGRHSEATDAFRAAVACDPAHSKAHAALIFAMDLDPRVAPAEAAAERKRWAARHGKPVSAHRDHTNDRDPDRRLRVGYISGDFKVHSAAEALAPVILSHSEMVQVVCYSEVRKPDAVTARFRASVPQWRDTWRMSDDELDACIRADGIDILVDLSGFTEGNRLTVFARKPAPVQVQAWGYPLGSGLASMDYLLSDRVLIPEEEHPFFAETVHYLPSCLAFAPPIEAPEPGPAPLVANGFVTFGSFNRATKINDDVLRIWAEILRRLPTARLFAKDAAFDEPAARSWFLDTLADFGIAAARVELRGKTSRREHLAAYSQVDIALDPFPGSGGVTTFECLWMGVPLVTLYGDRPAGRASASILAAIGMPEYVAASTTEYVAAALRLATDRDTLHAARAGLRDRVRSSILCDHDAYCAEVEAAYRLFWRRWCGVSGGGSGLPRR